jgi:hypothetical protein
VNDLGPAKRGRNEPHCREFVSGIIVVENEEGCELAAAFLLDLFNLFDQRYRGRMPTKETNHKNETVTRLPQAKSDQELATRVKTIGG